MKNNLPTLAIIVVALVASRYLIEGTTYLVYGNALINWAALLLVVYFIITQAKKELRQKIQESGVPSEIRDREIKAMKWRVNWVVYAPLLLIIIVYLIKFASPFRNDIISIIALCVSLSDTYIVDFLKNIYKV